MDYSVNSAIFNQLWSIMLSNISETCTDLLLYGIYFNLFIFAIHTLSRRETAGRNPLLVASWAMFILGTTGIVPRVIQTALSVRLLQECLENHANYTSELWHTYNSLVAAENIIFGINNFVTETLLLYRCYVIWGSQKKVIILPGILVLGTLITGFLAIAANHASSSLANFDLRTPYIMSTVANLVLVGLTAGRIWWIRRETLYFGLDEKFRKRYNTAIIILIESGAIYCMCGILIVFISSFDEMPIIFGGIVFGFAKQGLNIIPILIVVRVSLGHNIQDTIRNRIENPTGRQAPISLQPHQPSEPREVLHIKPMERE
ncbi:hypothetical protein C8R44DRAFT_822308 [Mycena epipterygia]|nr:hypothetical protein C8R44DRAFT_822308 [Mycena epipterygia]